MDLGEEYLEVNGRQEINGTHEEKTDNSTTVSVMFIHRILARLTTNKEHASSYAVHSLLTLPHRVEIYTLPLFSEKNKKGQSVLLKSAAMMIGQAVTQSPLKQ